MFYLQYWNPVIAKRENLKPFYLSNSNQKIFKKILKGDILWIITGYPDYKNIVLCGKLFVEYSIDGKYLCSKILKEQYYINNELKTNYYDLDKLDKRYYLISNLNHINYLDIENSLNINEVLQDLTFIMSNNSIGKFQYNGYLIEPQSLRTVRQLSSDSNKILEMIWKKNNYRFINF